MADFTSFLDKLAQQQENGGLFYWEKPLDALGLMRGSFAPFKRVGFGFILASTILWAVRPAFAFSEDGKPLPWSKTTRGGGASYPWWMIALGVGFAFGVFI